MCFLNEHNPHQCFHFIKSLTMESATHLHSLYSFQGCESQGGVDKCKSITHFRAGIAHISARVGNFRRHCRFPGYKKQIPWLCADGVENDITIAKMHLKTTTNKQEAIASFAYLLAQFRLHTIAWEEVESCKWSGMGKAEVIHISPFLTVSI